MINKNLKTHSQSVIESRRKIYDMIQFSVPKGEREIIKAYAEAQGLSLNAFVRCSIEKYIADLKNTSEEE